MKKWILACSLVAVLLVACAAQAVAAPNVSLKWGSAVGTMGVELGFPATDHFTVILDGGWTCWHGGLLLAGGRYYFLPEGLKPYVSLQGGIAYDPGDWYWALEGMVGVEYQFRSGIKIAGEVGALHVGDWYPVWGMSLGYQF